MANHKSALKRARQSKVRRARNRINKTKVNNAVKKTRVLLETGEPESLEKALRNAVKTIHKAKTKGTLHKRTASRRISRLSRQVYLAQKGRSEQASAPEGA
ncbi:MAG: 30S ribosomal protein S20 [Deltaproteobacteria bacterium]|nr:30S ribosomal protein S20 [Deltaproteobacteria bacterium]